MNRIVRENYPVSKLPEELQREFPGQLAVKLTVEAQAAPATVQGEAEQDHRADHFSRFRHLARPRYASTDDVLAHVSTSRDEWDEREQELSKLRGD